LGGLGKIQVAKVFKGSGRKTPGEMGQPFEGEPTQRRGGEQRGKGSEE